MQEEYYRQVQSEIVRWEERGPNYLNTISTSLLAPAQKAAESLIPTSVQEEITYGLDQAMLGLQAISRRLIDPVKLQSEVKCLTEDLGLEFMASDRMARRCWSWNLAYAGAGGALTGIGGWAGLVLDIPVVYAIAHRTVQEIASVYGYDVANESEQSYIHHLMTVGSCGDIETKIALLTELKKMELGLLKGAALRWGADIVHGHVARVATQEAAQTLGVQMARRKSLQVLPVVGALFGAATNAYLIHDLAESAYMNYRRRRLAELEGSLISN